VRDALAEKPALEVRRRLEKLLEKLPSEKTRLPRGLEALELFPKAHPRRRKQLLRPHMMPRSGWCRMSLVMLASQ
jgi:hypothetical protein